VKRKIITRVFVFLLLGAIVNVAVAWAAVLCSARQTIQFRASFINGNGGWIQVPGGNNSPIYYEFFGVTFENLCQPIDPIFSRTIPKRSSSTLGRDGIVRGFASASDFGIREVETHNRVFAGWPARCLTYAAMYPGSQWQQRLDRWHAGISTPWKFNSSGLGIQRRLPLCPIWPGFAINTVFYAGILSGGWLLFAAPLALRRRRRSKRGLCPACAYPVGDSPVCTECGKPLAKHKA
jgi:hypothetical protein